MATQEQIRQRALDLVAQQYDPQVRQINRGLTGLENALSRDVATQRGFAQEGSRTIRGAYDLLGRSLQAGVGQTRAIYDRGTNQIAGQYDRASQFNNTALDNVLAKVNGNAQRLGLEAAVPQGEADLRGNLAEIEALNQTSRAQSLANLTSLGTAMTGIAQKGVANAQREGASQQASLQSQVLNAITGAQAEAAQGRYNFMDELRGIESDRGRATRTTIEQLLEEQQERERQERLDRLAEEMQRGNLDLQRQQLSQNAAQFAQELEFKRQQLGQERDLAMRRLQAEKAAQGRAPTKQEYERVAKTYENSWANIARDAQQDIQSVVANQPGNMARPRTMAELGYDARTGKWRR